MSVIIERRKFASLQAGRGIAALMVVVCHIGAFVGIEPGLWGRKEMVRWLGPGKYGVDFFFILSGVVILLAHWSEVDVPSKIGPFLWKRFRRIYPIYWLILIPTVIKQLHVDTGYATDQRNPLVILSSFLLIHVASLSYNMLPSWTLFHEILFYLLFTALLWKKEIGVALFFCWFGASFFFFTSDSVSASPASYLAMLFSPLHLLFGFGLVVGWFLHHRRGSAQAGLLFSGLLVFISALLFNALHEQEDARVEILGGAGLAFAILVSAEREFLHKLYVPPAFIFLGDASYSIYLVHFMVISTIARKGFTLDQHWHLPLVVWMVVMFIAAVSTGIVVHLAIERPMLRWLSRPNKQVRNLIKVS